MRSLEDLRGAVRSETVRDQFDEVVRAYSSGAYRTATIALWIAVVQDLLGKVRELADGNDRAAVELIGRVETARAARDFRSLLEIERGILADALEKFELIEAVEHQQLERLHEDRNSCAHPSYQEYEEPHHAITEEQVRAHIVAAVESVLSQPTIVGKALTARFQADTVSESWPDDDALTDFLRNRYFSRARTSAKRQILQLAIKGSLNPPGGDNRLAGRNVAVLRSAIVIDEPALLVAVSEFLTKQKDNLDDSQLRRLLGSLGWLPRTWDVIGSENIVRCRVLLSASDVSDLMEDRAFASGLPASSDLEAPYMGAIRRLTAWQLRELTDRVQSERSQYLPAILRRLASATTVREAETLVYALTSLVNYFDLNYVRVCVDAFLANKWFSHAFKVPEPLVYIVGARNLSR